MSMLICIKYKDTHTHTHMHTVYLVFHLNIFYLLTKCILKYASCLMICNTLRNMYG